jgi:wyosine [tRNA(Phe)-imidazoG37] synthetase (radical SAM superfamily)
MIGLVDEETIAFGPVPSRRLGRSLGINNVPAKTCSYSCVYCQVGRTTEITCERRAFYKPEDIATVVKQKIRQASLSNETIDYLTFVPEGEPTLDINLGKGIVLLRSTGFRVAVLTNASLVWRRDIREDLQKADVVCLKIDAVTENIWRKINRPHKDLNFDIILEGIIQFAKEFQRTIVTETMLIGDVNYGDELDRIAEFLANLKKLNRAYIAVPTRPPTEKWVTPPREEVMIAAFQVFSEKLGIDRVECLVGNEGNAFAFTGRVEHDLLGITAVHPMRETAIMEFLKKANADWEVVERLLKEGKLVALEYEGHRYYVRKLKQKAKTNPKEEKKR